MNCLVFGWQFKFFNSIIESRFFNPQNSDNLNNKKLIEEKQNLKFSLKKSISYRNSSEAHEINTNVEMIHAEKEVPYSWWFKLAINDKNFGYQDYSTINARWEKERDEAKLRGDDGATKLF